jgi:hypothetical protein
MNQRQDMMTMHVNVILSIFLLSAVSNSNSYSRKQIKSIKADEMHYCVSFFLQTFQADDKLNILALMHMHW